MPGGEFNPAASNGAMPPHLLWYLYALSAHSTALPVASPLDSIEQRLSVTTDRTSSPKATFRADTEPAADKIKSSLHSPLSSASSSAESVSSKHRNSMTKEKALKVETSEEFSEDEESESKVAEEHDHHEHDDEKEEPLNGMDTDNDHDQDEDQAEEAREEAEEEEDEEEEDEEKKFQSIFDEENSYSCEKNEEANVVDTCASLSDGRKKKQRLVGDVDQDAESN